MRKLRYEFMEMRQNHRKWAISLIIGMIIGIILSAVLIRTLHRQTLVKWLCYGWRGVLFLLMWIMVTLVLLFIVISVSELLSRTRK